MFLVSLKLKLLACEVWKLDPPGALTFFIRIYNCLSMGFPIQSEYYVIRKTHWHWNALDHVAVSCLLWDCGIDYTPNKLN